MKLVRMFRILTTSTMVLLPHLCLAVKVEEELAHTLILAASPFVNNTDWRPSSLARRLNLSNSDSSKSNESKSKKIAKDDSVSETSRIHEIRVPAPFSVRRTIDREGKSLYSPGPYNDR